MKLWKMIILITSLLVTSIFFNTGSIFARENVTDWYIKDFDSRIIVRSDSSLEITEKITADCGRGVDKHGIFRVLPESVNVDGKIIRMPVKLISITDFNGKSINLCKVVV